MCEIALASWLVDAGLRVKAIGRVLKQLREQGGLTQYLRSELSDMRPDDFLAVTLAPKGKQSLQQSVLIESWENLANIFKRDRFSSVLVIPVGTRFFWLARRSEEQEEQKGV